MNYIVIFFVTTVLTSSHFSIVSQKNFDSVETNTESSYKIYNNVNDLKNFINENIGNNDLHIITVIGCNWAKCEQYEYKLTTTPEIKNTVELTKKEN